MNCSLLWRGNIRRASPSVEHGTRRWLGPSTSRDLAQSGFWWCLKLSSWSDFGIGAELQDQVLWSTDNFPLLSQSPAAGRPALACHCTVLHSQAGGRREGPSGSLMMPRVWEGIFPRSIYLLIILNFFTVLIASGVFFLSRLQIFFCFLYIHAADIAEIVAAFLPRNNCIWQCWIKFLGNLELLSTELEEKSRSLCRKQFIREECWEGASCWPFFSFACVTVIPTVLFVCEGQGRFA